MSAAVSTGPLPGARARGELGGPHPDSRPEEGRTRGLGSQGFQNVLPAGRPLPLRIQPETCGRWQGWVARSPGSLPEEAPATPPFPLGSLCLLSQSESEEKVVTYDHIGPNVCMGDHKVMCPRRVVQGRPRGAGRRGAAGRAPGPQPAHPALAKLVRVYLIVIKYQKVGGYLGR